MEKSDKAKLKSRMQLSHRHKLENIDPDRKEQTKSWEAFEAENSDINHANGGLGGGQTKFNPFEQLRYNIIDKVKRYEDQQQEIQAKKNSQSLAKLRSISKNRDGSKKRMKTERSRNPKHLNENSDDDIASRYNMYHDKISKNYLNDRQSIEQAMN